MTQKMFDALPVASAKSHISGLQAIYVHHNLASNPASLRDDTGHYRLGKRQWKLAAAAAAGSDSYDGPLDGELSKLLQRIAGVSTGLFDDGSSEPSDDFPEGGQMVTHVDTDTDKHDDKHNDKCDDKCTKSDAKTETTRNVEMRDDSALADLARRLANEALSELQRLTDAAVRTEFESRRKEILKNALDSLD
jgi:hypothetical protein